MSELPPSPPPKTNYALGVVLLVILTVAAVAFLLFIPDRSGKKPQHRLASRTHSKARCLENMRQINYALQNYHRDYASLPPAYTVDADGKPLHSWRVLLLPALGHEAIYQSIRLDEPWDSDHNKQFHGRIIDVFECPDRPTVGGCAYSVVVGPGTAFEEGGKAISFSDITDGQHNTILLVERATPLACWMDPTREIALEEALKGVGKSPDGIGSPHLQGRTATGHMAHVAYADYWANGISDSLSTSDLEALLLRNDGRSVTRP